jgi:hypothetical protein
VFNFTVDWRHSLTQSTFRREFFCCVIVLRCEVVDCYEIRRDPVCVCVCVCVLELCLLSVAVSYQGISGCFSNEIRQSTILKLGTSDIKPWKLQRLLAKIKHFSWHLIPKQRVVMYQIM